MGQTSGVDEQAPGRTSEIDQQAVRQTLEIDEYAVGQTSISMNTGVRTGPGPGCKGRQLHGTVSSSGEAEHSVSGCLTLMAE